jgi:hypothetical protein
VSHGRSGHYGKETNLLPLPRLEPGLLGRPASSPGCYSGIATGYGLDGRRFVPGRGKIFVCSIVSRPALGSTQPHIQWVPGVLSPWVKWQELEAYHSSPSSTDIKYGGAIPPLPYMSSLHSA